MITIDSPTIKQKDGYSVLECPISIDNESHIIWFSVDSKYGQYLCYERGDACLVAILNYAMRNKHDITCEVPITEELYYNIDKYLLDALAKYNSHFYRPVIHAPIATDELPCEGAVGTGVSCGVDSLHAIFNQTNLKFKKHNITHLSFNNVGSHGVGEQANALYAKRLQLSRKFAEEYGFEFVASNSNLMDIIKQNHFLTHTYSSMFPVFCLQKLYAVYYYASAGYSYEEFSLSDAPTRSSGSYELLSLPLFSTRQLRIYSEGEGLSRMEKLTKVVNYKPAYKYLNVCLCSFTNCNTCEKCIRTLLGLDALKSLDNFSNCFDVKYYREHKTYYMRQLLIHKALGKHDYFELYEYLKCDISLLTRMSILHWLLYYKLKGVLSFVSEIIKHLTKHFSK